MKNNTLQEDQKIGAVKTLFNCFTELSNIPRQRPKVRWIVENCNTTNVCH